jgi:hypothetical protein
MGRDVRCHAARQTAGLLFAPVRPVTASIVVNSKAGVMMSIRRRGRPLRSVSKKGGAWHRLDTFARRIAAILSKADPHTPESVTEALAKLQPLVTRTAAAAHRQRLRLGLADTLAQTRRRQKLMDPTHCREWLRKAVMTGSTSTPARRRPSEIHRLVVTQIFDVPDRTARTLRRKTKKFYWR